MIRSYLIALPTSEFFMKINFIFLVILASLMACSTPAKKITAIDYKRIGPKCIPLAKVVTENKEGIEALAQMEAEKKVRELNGDTLAIEESVRNGEHIKFSGVAYRCKNEE
jgi:hydroxymethylpyrimidine/phosphomethylpyrimidine kinase